MHDIVHYTIGRGGSVVLLALYFKHLLTICMFYFNHKYDLQSMFNFVLPLANAFLCVYKYNVTNDILGIMCHHGYDRF